MLYLYIIRAIRYSDVVSFKVLAVNEEQARQHARHDVPGALAYIIKQGE